MTNSFIKYENHCVMVIKNIKGLHFVLLDNEDVERVKSFGSWNLDDKGYVMCRKRFECKSIVFLARFLLDFPKDLVVDHINRNPLDNRKSNLRAVTYHINNANTKCNNKVVGVSKCRNMWRASLGINMKRISKYYKTYEEAVQGRKELEQLYLS